MQSEWEQRLSPETEAAYARMAAILGVVQLAIFAAFYVALIA